MFSAARDPTERELRRQILERPGDDDLRRVYADRLEELGDEIGAARIRAQIALANLDRLDPGWLIARAEVERVMPTREQLARELGFEYGELRRGLPVKAAYTAPAFVREAPKLFAEHPIEALMLFGMGMTPEMRDELVAMPELAQIRELELLGLDPPEIKALLATGAFDRVTRLSAYHTPGLVDSVPRGLEALVIGTGVLAGDVNELVGSGRLTSLRALELLGGTVDATTATAIKRHLPRLERLRVTADDDAFAALAGLELRALDLSSNDHGASGVLQLSPTLEYLRIAALSAGFERLEGAAPRVIDLSGTYLGDRGLAALLSGSAVNRVERLDLEQTSIGDRGVDALCDSAVIERVIELDVGLNRLGDTGIARLAAINAPRLRGLGLSAGFAETTGRGLEALLASPIIKSLQYLGLAGNRIDGALLEGLLEVDTDLVWLDLTGVDVDPELRERLDARFVCTKLSAPRFS